MKIKCLIVDDEPLAINVIKRHLKGFDEFEVVATCNDAMEAFKVLKNTRIHLMFLDINMPELSGIDFIKGLDEKPLVVITTAYREFAVESFELDVFDYLVKPIALPRFVKTIDKAIDFYRLLNSSRSKHNEANDYLFVKVDKKIVKVFFSDILYIESLKDYVRIVTQYENLITHHNLRSISRSLPADKFLRIHRSYTISIEKVRSLEGNNVQIQDKMIPIGRNYQKKIKKHILKDGNEG